MNLETLEAGRVLIARASALVGDLDKLRYASDKLLSAKAMLVDRPNEHHLLTDVLLGRVLRAGLDTVIRECEADLALLRFPTDEGAPC